MKLAWGIIVLPTDSEAEKLDRSLASFNGIVDKFFITITGENKKCEEVAQKYNAEISHFEWIQDFAAARNFNFSQIKGYDWIGWSDADDVVVKPEKIKKFLEVIPEEATAVAARYEYSHDKYGNITVEQWRERIIRGESGYKWVGAIHETLIDKNYPSIIKTNEFYFDHKHEVNLEKTSVRNLQILENEIKKQRESGKEMDPRLVYYLATTYKELEMYEESVALFQTFLKTSGWDEQRYDGHLQMSDIGLALADKDLAINGALHALNERPDFPDACFQLGKIYFEQQNWNKCIQFIKDGLEKKVETDWILVSRRPQALLHLGLALTNIGKFDESNKYLKELSKIWPGEKAVKDQIKLNTKLEIQKEVVNSYFKIYKYINQEDKKLLTDLMETVPKSISDNPAIIQMKQASLPVKKWGDDSIVIYCDESWEEWSPKSVNSGIGGSEEAVIELSKQLVNLGKKVTVYNSCGNDAGIYEGVEYKNFWEFNPKDEFNILIGWRTPGFFARKYNAKKSLLWMHDVYDADVWTKQILDNVDKVMVLSKYHRELWPNIPDDKIMYFQNGLVPEHFSGKVKRQNHRIIYSSCPSRGLEYLLDIWPEVKEKYPDAELHYYYGWENWTKGNHNYAGRMAWMEQMKEKSKQPGIYSHGRVGHKELAKEMMKSQIWAYPCIFPEIFCITATKAQAAGAVPVVIPYGAVDETTQYGYKTKNTDIFADETKKEFKDLLIQALGHPGEVFTKEMIDWSLNKFSWLKTAQMLLEKIDG